MQFVCITLFCQNELKFKSIQYIFDKNKKYLNMWPIADQNLKINKVHKLMLLIFVANVTSKTSGKIFQKIQFKFTDVKKKKKKFNPHLMDNTKNYLV